jgi:hypothetical protein
MTARKQRRRDAQAFGPCYDFCSCRLCWRGWANIPFRTRLRWRIDFIVHQRGSEHPLRLKSFCFWFLSILAVELLIARVSWLLS